MASVANPRGFAVNSSEFSFSPVGYLAQIEWVKMRDKPGNLIMFEDFNDPNKLARFNTAFLCATAAPCQTAFVNYYNQQQGTSYSYVQIDSLYHHFTGRSLDVCGAMERLVLIKKEYNRDANPYRVNVIQYLNTGANDPNANHRNRDYSFDDGIFRWPDYIRDTAIYDTWWRYSNLGFTSSICADDGFTIEGSVRALKDNLRVSEENFTISVGNNLSAVLYKRTDPGTSGHGFNLSRINITKGIGDTAVTYNVLSNGVKYKIDTTPSFLSKQWHTFKLQVTKTKIS